MLFYFKDDLKTYGRKRGWCPYFLARYAVSYIRKNILSYFSAF